jgi:hypothetical protein
MQHPDSNLEVRRTGQKESPLRKLPEPDPVVSSHTELNRYGAPRISIELKRWLNYIQKSRHVNFQIPLGNAAMEEYKKRLALILAETGALFFDENLVL